MKGRRDEKQRTKIGSQEEKRRKNEGMDVWSMGERKK